MACKHADGNTCLLIKQKCIYIEIDAAKCSEDNSGIIKYLKNSGVYEVKVENDPKFLPQNATLDKCPKCQSTNITTEPTMNNIEYPGIIFDDLKAATCNECGWEWVIVYI